MTKDKDVNGVTKVDPFRNLKRSSTGRRPRVITGDPFDRLTDTRSTRNRGGDPEDENSGTACNVDGSHDCGDDADTQTQVGEDGSSAEAPKWDQSSVTITILRPLTDPYDMYGRVAWHLLSPSEKRTRVSADVCGND